MVRWRVVCGYRTHEQAESAGRDGAVVSENEAVERMALAMYRGAGMEQTVSWTVNAESNREEWRGLARTALTSHPAVDVLRDVMLHDFSADEARLALMVMRWAGHENRNGRQLQERCAAMQKAQDRARTVLAMVDEQVQQALDARGGAS